jgi:hypothetical protein
MEVVDEVNAGLKATHLGGLRLLETNVRDSWNVRNRLQKFPNCLELGACSARYCAPVENYFVTRL